MARLNSQKGYTLVELLIAMVILLSLIFTANYSYSLYSQYWAGRLGTFDRTTFYYQGLQQVKETIESSIPYIVDGGKVDDTFYFLGRAEGFTLVTAAPIFAKTINDAAVVRIFSEPVKSGGFQLVYEEAPLSEKLLLTLDQQLDFKYRTVLMQVEQLPKFEYLAWDSSEQKYGRGTTEQLKPSWRGDYDAAKTKVQPLKIRLNLDSSMLEYDLPEGHLKLLDVYILGRDSK